MRARSLGLTALLLGAFVAPGVPSYADDSDDFGLLCGFTATNDTNGVVQQNPDVFFGELDAGPLFLADWRDDPSNGTSHTEPTSGELSCWIQVNDPNNGTAQDDAHRNSASSCQFQGFAVIAGACQITFTAQTGTNVYLCVVLYNSHGTTPDYVHDDDDDETNGKQCSLAISVGTPED